MDMMFIDYLARFGHMVFGVTWIGLLYYFNFVQTEYFKELYNKLVKERDSLNEEYIQLNSDP